MDRIGFRKSNQGSRNETHDFNFKRVLDSFDGNADGQLSFQEMSSRLSFLEMVDLSHWAFRFGEPIAEGGDALKTPS
jgi:hypothetical protein